MASRNRVDLIGHLGADPERRTMPSGDSVVTLRLATTDRWTDKQTREKREHTEWHRIVYYGRIADVCSEYLSKGDMISVVGRLRTQKWTDKQQIERYSTEVVGEEMLMLVTRNRRNTHTAGSPAGQAGTATNSGQSPRERDDFDDDIPF